jgi:multidrug efflux pump subunit AcrA (membrane-fusion protein)
MILQPERKVVEKVNISLRAMTVWILGIAAVAFTLYAFARVSATSSAAEPPDMDQSPARVYGFIEPAGREVLVWPPFARRVISVWIAEGDEVTEGQKLCTLENSVERQELDLARARVASYLKALELSRDLRDRAGRLFADSATSEIEYTQAKLKAELDSANVLVAREEVDRARALLDQLELRSPIDGIVYRFNVRLGESLAAGDAGGECPIILGSADLWVRLYVESFWGDRVGEGATYDVHDAETGEYIGAGRVVYIAPYVGRRGFRSEDVNERFDVGYREVVLDLETAKANIPLGLSVMADLAK